MNENSILVARDMGVDASWGHIYGPVDFAVSEGGVTVLAGRGGRGRTALLLTLAGRMKPTTGSLEAFGRTDDVHHLFSNAGLAFIDEVDEIEQTIRVHDVVTEQLRWAAPWYKIVEQGKDEDLERMCRPVFGDLPIPPLSAYVEELPELTATLFRIAVANLRRPPILVVGGVDKLSSDHGSRLLLERLIELGKTQTVITADVNGAPGVSGLRDVIEVAHLTDSSFLSLVPERA